MKSTERRVWYIVVAQEMSKIFPLWFPEISTPTHPLSHHVNTAPDSSAWPFHSPTTNNFISAPLHPGRHGASIMPGGQAAVTDKKIEQMESRSTCF